MKINIILRLQKAVLAERRGTHCRVMDTAIKDGELVWELNQVRWRWMMNEAMASVPGTEDVSVDYIRLPVYVKAPKLCMYERKYTLNGEKKKETFEAFPAGSRITVPIFILNEMESDDITDKRPPTKEEVLAMFEVAGESIGISPWGSKFGYGRFDIARTDDDIAKS